MKSRCACVMTSLCVAAAPALGASHLWDVNEIFSNADGSVQFIELHVPCGGAGCASEEAIGGKSVTSIDTGNMATFGANVPDGTTGLAHLLLGTQAFADLPGAPTPDLIIPENFFTISGDTVRWHLGPPTYDQVSFGAGMLPTDGVMSLNHDLSTGVNSPTNFAGESGTVDAGGGGGECTTFADCADLDDDGIRDDNCVWWACTAGVCEPTDIVFADMGSQFGACPPDGAADGNDRFLALTCFAGKGWQNGECEPAPPAATNLDAGGPFGSCAADGVCDGNDAFHALNAFAGESSCACPLDGAPLPTVEPPVTGQAAVTLLPLAKRLRPGETLAVEAYLDTPVDDFRGYQLHLGVTALHGGHLDLIDISVDHRRDAVFAGAAPWTAFNAATGQMVAGLDSPGIDAPGGAYLATFTYQASRDASGPFRIELLHDVTDATQRTFLFRTDPQAVTEIRVDPVVVDVVAGPQRWNTR